jgi:hypothetical protein
MELDTTKLKETLRASLCREVGVYLRQDSRVIINTPFRFPDGDSLLIIAEPLPTGGLRLSDCGHTLMHLSYDMDTDDTVKPGSRGELFRRIINESGLSFEGGRIFADVSTDDIGRAVSRLGQALGRILDMSYPSRNGVELKPEHAYQAARSPEQAEPATPGHHGNDCRPLLERVREAVARRRALDTRFSYSA